MGPGSVVKGAGALLAAATRGVASVRRTPKPLHPRGVMSVGSISGRPGAATGVGWIDDPGTDRVLVRRSRAVGLPAGWPDVHGLAVRVHLPGGGVGDLLLASTGRGPLTRFLLHAGRRPERLFFGSLLPYCSPIGPVLVAAIPGDSERWVLLWAQSRGPWTPFADLELGPEMPDADMSFDPVLNRLPGLQQYDAIARLRCPAYRTARRARDDTTGGRAA